MDGDFDKAPKKSLEGLKQNEDERIKKITTLFEGISIDYKTERSIESGTASYVLSTICYSYFDPKQCPTAKRAMCTIRTAWLLGDLEETYKNGKFAYFQEVFYKKAHKYYSDTLDFAQTGKEPLGDIFLGPDSDKNYGYDGVIYLTSLLNFRLAYLEKDPMARGNIYYKSKIMMAKIFGFGKSSKEKPSTILNQAKDLYEQITQYLQQIEEELGTKFG